MSEKNTSAPVHGPRSTVNGQRVFMIGWDGATFDLIHPWVAQGKLPNIARLLETGVHGSLRSTLPPWTFPAWTSFMTGKNPGKHGIFDFLRSGPARTTWSLSTAAIGVPRRSGRY